MSGDYLGVTELAGAEVTGEQVSRLCNRYYWARKYCENKDVLEAACGTGQGLGYLAKMARSVRAGDFSAEILKIAREHYGDRIALQQFDAQNMPFEDDSFDVVILFEAIYYLPSADKFISECRRVLRNGGKILIATANKDLYDFNPSPYSYCYYGIVELAVMFEKWGFNTEFFGNTPVEKLSFRQKIFRPVKKLAVKLGLVPNTMEGKKLLKRLVFGKLVKMPAEIDEGIVSYVEPVELEPSSPDRKHKVIFCVASIKKD